MIKTVAAAGAAVTLLVGATSAAAVALPAPVQVDGHADHAAHGQATAGEDHSQHGGDGGHTTPSANEEHGTAGAEEDGHEEGGHDTGEPDSVSDVTRASVLGGFGAVNAAVIGGAFLLRRRDRRADRPTRHDRKARR